ncbi:MAG TPA: hypothetical protein VI137_12225, partial [Pseudolabrys sp.]
NERIMPRRKQPPRLYLRPARRNKQGKLRAKAVWIILDGGKHIATGCFKGEIERRSRPSQPTLQENMSPPEKSGTLRK